MATPLLTDILRHNGEFVDRREYEPFITDAFPDKKLVVVTCMDTRLTELLPRAMGLRNGDAKIIKIAGAIVAHPFGSVMRSIIMAIYLLHAEEIAIVGHHGCGITGLNCADVLNKARSRGVSVELLSTLRHAGIDLEGWLRGFDRVEDGILQSVEVVRQHPLMPKDVPVHGLIMHPETGKLDVLVDGSKS